MLTLTGKVAHNSCDEMTLLVQYLVAICVFVLVVHGEKRLLLSDPDVINNRLLQMEKTAQIW
jgi:hypothetical protein